MVRGDHEKHMAAPQTVLLHESVRPPFSLRCPHCGGEIAIDYAGKPGANHDDETAEKAADQRGQTAGAVSVAYPSRTRLSTINRRRNGVPGGRTKGYDRPLRLEKALSLARDPLRFTGNIAIGLRAIKKGRFPSLKAVFGQALAA